MAVVYNLGMDQGADWDLNVIYKQPASITNVTGNGTTVTYTAANSFSAGQTVSIDQVMPYIYNLQNVVIATASATQFTVTNGATGIYISGGLATAPLNITGYTAKMQMRSYPDSATAVLTLTTENGGIAITGATGNISLHATATQTGAINQGPYDYDLEIYQGSSVTRVIQGQIDVSAQVTR
jgi:hypothetical protein